MGAARRIDFARVAGERRRLDQVVKEHPELTEPEVQRRLERVLDDDQEDTERDDDNR